MKKALWIILAVALLIGFSIWVYKNAGSRIDNTVDESKLYDLDLQEREILVGIKKDREKFDKLVRDFQLTPKSLIEFNYKIMKLAYQMNDKDKLAISDEDLKLLGSVQRLYYDKQLLKENDEKTFYENLKKDVRKANKSKVFYIDYEIKEPIDEIDGESVVNVCYILNGSVDDLIYEQYLLRKSEGLWYIVGWRNIDKEQYEKNR